jgi:hypothetical protein
MSDIIETLLLRNLQEVFGEGDPAHRRTAIEELYTEDCTVSPPHRPLRRPSGAGSGRRRIAGRSSELRLHTAQHPASGSGWGTHRVGIRTSRRAAPLHWARRHHRPRREDRRPLRLPRLAARMKLDTAIDDNRGWMRNLVIGNSRRVSAGVSDRTVGCEADAIELSRARYRRCDPERSPAGRPHRTQADGRHAPAARMVRAARGIGIRLSRHWPAGSLFIDGVTLAHAAKAPRPADCKWRLALSAVKDAGTAE